MEEEGSNNYDNPPAPPQPPQFSTCSAAPGSPAWFSYWANEARETFDYNQKIAEYGKEMELWSRKISGLSAEDIIETENSLPEAEPEPKQLPTSAETQTVICQQEQCTSSESLQKNTGVILMQAPLFPVGTQTGPPLDHALSTSTMPTNITQLDGSEMRRNVRMINNNPYMDIFNEFIDFPHDDNTQDHEDVHEFQRYFSHEIEIVRELLVETEASEVEAEVAGTKLLEQGENNIIEEKVGAVGIGSVLEDPDTNTTENIELGEEAASRSFNGHKARIMELGDQMKDIILQPMLRENINSHISDVVKNIFNGLSGFAVNVKNGIGGFINDMKADALNTRSQIGGIFKGNSRTERGPVDIHESYVNYKWQDEEYSQDNGGQSPRRLDTLNSQEYVSPDEQHNVQMSDSTEVNYVLSAKANEILVKEPQKSPVFRASMELGAFEINTWKESNGSTVRSGTTVRILCFNFKRFTTTEGTRLVFDKGVIDEDSLKVVCQQSPERLFLEVTASRNGKMEELTIFLPKNTDFDEIKIVDISKRYLSVSIPFYSQYSEVSKRNRHSSLLNEVH